MLMEGRLWNIIENTRPPPLPPCRSRKNLPKTETYDAIVHARSKAGAIKVGKYLHSVKKEATRILFKNQFILSSSNIIQQGSQTCVTC